MSRPGLAVEVGELLAKVRADQSLSRRALARYMGEADTTLLEIERGDANPTLERLEKVAAAYGVRLRVTAEVVRTTPLAEAAE